MKIIFCLVLTLLAIASNVCAQRYRPQTGDILLQSLKSDQSEAIQIATKSPYSHVGVVFIKDDKPFVLEAIEPVQFTPMNIWIKRGANRKYVAKRLVKADSILTKDNLADLIETGKLYLGKHYDIYFNWSDSSMYCSELVWKLYHEALDLDLTMPAKLSSFDLEHPIVSAKLRERYGTNVPLEEPVVAPSALFDSKYLTTVYQRK